MRISDWSSDVCSSDLLALAVQTMRKSMEFTDLGLSEPVLKAVAEAGYTTPTPIQAQAIPIVLMGRDVLGTAQTGTGKTAGFTLPLIDRSEERRVGKEGVSQCRSRWSPYH